MLLPKEMGTYAAKPMEWSVIESGSNKIPTFQCRFDLYNFETRGEWRDCQYEITGFFYLFKKDGQPNATTIESLKAALGWDGASIASLANGEWSDKAVRLVVDQEEYEGKMKTKVKWINPIDGGEGMSIEHNPQIIQSLEAKYGPMLRALNGATAPANGKAPPKAPNRQAPNAAAGASIGKRAAWESFKVRWEEYVADNPDQASNRDARWKELLHELFSGQDVNKVTEAQWADAAKTIEADYSPAVGLIPI